jgi:hypothetical protein
MRLLRPVLLPLVALLVLAPTIAAAGTNGRVLGYYTYYPFNNPDAPRTLLVNAGGGGYVKGSWTQVNSETGAILRAGLVTCVVTEGDDGWMAGPETYRAPGLYTSAGSFLHVHGPRPAEGEDSAVTWFGDPGQPLSEMIGWCQNQNTEIPLFPVVVGNVDVLP